MLSEEVYASVIWALVMATVMSPISFRWALRVFDRATPIHRSSYIGGDDVKFKKRAFVIRVAGKYTPGVQNEIFHCLHASGVDVLEAHLVGVRVDDAPDAELESFANNFTVLSRGQKKDFDDEKLEEMHHALAEILNDQDAQILFEPANEDFTRDGVLEVQILGEHHQDLLSEVTTVLSEMKIDVVKAMADHSQQPGHAHHDSTVRSRADGENSIGRTSRLSRGNSGHLDLSQGRKTITNSIKGLYTSTRRRTTITHVHSDEAKKHHEVGREIFYARDGANELTLTPAQRRHDIKLRLQELLHEHQLHGEVLVRQLHASEMALVHTVPKFLSPKDVSVVRCVGDHHADLLHEICEALLEAKLDVLHADMDMTEEGKDMHSFYVTQSEGKKLASDWNETLISRLNGLYVTHGKYGRARIENVDEFSPSSSSRPTDPRRGSLAAMPPMKLDALSSSVVSASEIALSSSNPASPAKA